MEVIKTLRDKGIWIGELAAVKKDGSTLNVHLLASMITDKSGKPISMMFSFVKITDTAIAFFNLKGNLTYVNNSFLKLWDYDDDAEILGNPFVEFWQMEEKALEVIATLRDKGRWIGELVAMKKDGSTLDVHFTASRVKTNYELRCEERSNRITN